MHQEGFEAQEPREERSEGRAGQDSQGRARHRGVRGRRDPHRGDVPPAGRVRGEEPSLRVHAQQAGPRSGHGRQARLAHGHGQGARGLQGPVRRVQGGDGGHAGAFERIKMCMIHNFVFS